MRSSAGWLGRSPSVTFGARCPKRIVRRALGQRSPSRSPRAEKRSVSRGVQIPYAPFSPAPLSETRMVERASRARNARKRARAATRATTENVYRSGNGTGQTRAEAAQVGDVGSTGWTATTGTSDCATMLGWPASTMAARDHPSSCCTGSPDTRTSGTKRPRRSRPVTGLWLRTSVGTGVANLATAAEGPPKAPPRTPTSGQAANCGRHDAPASADLRRCAAVSR
jgi:hypothetical protein